jgi:hypothetical protein
MLISHTMESGIMSLKLCCQLDVTNRAAAVLDIQGLLYAHRPSRVVIELPPNTPSSATLSTMLRTERLCGTLGIPFGLAPSSRQAARLLQASAQVGP